MDAGLARVWPPACVSDLSTDIARAAGRSTVALAGELDVGTVPALRDLALGEIGDNVCTTLVLDLSRLTFLDSTGIGVLIELRNRAEDSNVRFVLQALSPSVLRTMQMSGLAGLFDL